MQMLQFPVNATLHSVCTHTQTHTQTRTHRTNAVGPTMRERITRSIFCPADKPTDLHTDRKHCIRYNNCINMRIYTFTQQQRQQQQQWPAGVLRGFVGILIGCGARYVRRLIPVTVCYESTYVDIMARSVPLLCITTSRDHAYDQKQTHYCGD